MFISKTNAIFVAKFCFMTIGERIQSRLKPKVRQFGFTRKVFKSVAAQIADKLGDVDENASEDDINAKIDEVIEASLPFLALIQSQANEQFTEWKKGQTKNDGDDDPSGDDGDDSKSDPDRRDRSRKSARTTENDEEPAWFKKYREEQDAKLEALRGEKIADTRRSKMETLLKDSGSFGKTVMKFFAKAKFESDEDFDEYYSDVEEDLRAYNQERADAGLSTMGNPPGGKGGERGDKIEVISEDEVKALANM